MNKFEKHKNSTLHISSTNITEILKFIPVIEVTSHNNLEKNSLKSKQYKE